MDLIQQRSDSNQVEMHRTINIGGDSHAIIGDVHIHGQLEVGDEQIHVKNGWSARI